MGIDEQVEVEGAGRKSSANYEITTRMGIQIQILHQQKQQQLCERNRLDTGDTITLTHTY